ncbi:MAG: IgGFc-binding protein [Nannocystaceae bacterium]|nr:IgGFc-binding protein [Nannocystaceae bacterium]
MVVFRWLVLCAVVGCGPSVSGGSGESTGNEATGTSASLSPTGPSGESLGEDPTTENTAVDSTGSATGQVCEPGETRCSSDESLGVCAPDGMSWNDEPCGVDATCVPCDEQDGCTADRCVGPCDDPTTSLGCDFVIARLLSAREEFEDAVVLTAPAPTRAATVQLFRIAEGSTDETLIQETTLAGGEFVRWALQDDVGPAASWYRTGSTYRVRSDVPIAAYHHAPGRTATSNDSSLLLPVAALGTRYVVSSYGPLGAQAQDLGVPSYFEIIVLSDDTNIEWVPPVPTAGDGAAFAGATAGGTGSIVSASAGDAVRVAASNVALGIPIDARDLSGTVISSDKPIWVAGGTRCARIPVRTDPVGGFCDTIQEVLVPVQWWGHETVAAPPPSRGTENHYWRVYAGADGTTSFTTEPAVLTADNCPSPADFLDGVCTLPELGAWIEIRVANGVGFVVRGVAPEHDRFMVVGYLQSRRAAGEPAEASTDIGDPAMYQMVDTAAFGRSHVVTSGVGFSSDWIQVVRRVGGAAVFVGPIAISSWMDLGEFEYSDVPLNASSVGVQSEDPFGLVQFGYADPAQISPECSARSGSCASSYAHSAGWSSRGR